MSNRDLSFDIARMFYSNWIIDSRDRLGDGNRMYEEHVHWIPFIVSNKN